MARFSPSHGDTASNPVGDTNEINDLDELNNWTAARINELPINHSRRFTRPLKRGGETLVAPSVASMAKTSEASTSAVACRHLHS